LLKVIFDSQIDKFGYYDRWTMNQTLLRQVVDKNIKPSTQTTTSQGFVQAMKLGNRDGSGFYFLV
jgi:hypothetical protein